MKNAKNLLILLLVALTIMSIACSSGKSPVEPATDTFGISNDMSEPIVADGENRDIIAVYDAEINLDAETFTITPSDRITASHMPLSQTYPGVLSIVNVQYSPTFWADIRLTHPYPGSGINAFDPRVIAIMPANAGVRFVYPSLFAVGNNRVVLQPDGYTNLFDSLGGTIPGTVNPFKAYFKDQPYRVWSGTGVTTETQRWDMDLAGFGGLMKFKLVVDVSTNYPQPPVPGIDNAAEPIEVKSVVCNGLNDLGGSGQIEVTLFDWQGPSNIICRIEAPSLYTGLVNLTYNRPSPNINEYVFAGTIPNTLIAAQGTYNILIGMADVSTSTNRIFNESTVTVGAATFNPVDVTPTNLNFEADNIAVSGNLAFATSTSGMGANTKLYIFDITNPASPTMVTSVDMPERTTDLAALNGYAYVTTGLSGVQIVNANPPQTASIVNVVNTPGIAKAITIEGTHAYVADGPYGAGINIINIPTPETAVSVRTLNIWGDTTEVEVSGSYAYAINDLDGLVIADIHDPPTASVVTSLTTSGTPYDVDELGGYAFVVNLDGILDVIDVQPPQTASIVKSVPFTAYQPRIAISGGVAYVVDGGYRNLYIVDISDPLNPFGINLVQTPNIASDLAVLGGYAYIADVGSIQVVSVTPPQSAHIAGSIFGLCNVRGVAVSGNYAYLSDYESGLHIVDISVPGSEHIVKTVLSPLPCEGGVAYSNGYAYLCAGINGLKIIDVDPVPSAHIVATISSAGNAWNVSISGNYAYIADGAGGVKIIDISSPGLPAPVQTLTMPDWTWDVEVSGNYAYASMVSQGLAIVDISVPGSASIINTVPLPGMCGGLKLANGYAYVSNGYSGLQIVDIDPPMSASIINAVVAPGYSFSYNVCLLGGYALAADYGYALRILDIDPPLTASIINSVPMTAPYDISISNGYAYVAELDFGLDIIKLM